MTTTTWRPQDTPKRATCKDLGLCQSREPRCADCPQKQEPEKDRRLADAVMGQLPRVGAA